MQSSKMAKKAKIYSLDPVETPSTRTQGPEEKGKLEGVCTAMSLGSERLCM